MKTLVIGSLASSLVLEGCLSKEKEIIYENVWKYKYGRTPEELERDLKLLNQVFFSKEELNTIRVLANLIVPPTTEGNIDQAEVPEFIEFIVKDTPSFQGVLKDGLKWLDTTSNKNFGEIAPAPIKSNSFFCISLSFNLFSNNGAERLFSNKNFSYFNL